MKFVTLLIAGLLVSSTSAFAISCFEALAVQPAPVTYLSSSPIISILRLISERPLSLTYQKDLYTKPTAKLIKQSRYQSALEGSRNVKVSIYFDISYRRAKLRDSTIAWLPTGKASLFAVSYSGKSTRLVNLLYTGPVYSRPVVGGDRLVRYSGYVVDDQGQRSQVVVTLEEHNPKPGSRSSRWQLSREGFLFVQMLR